MSLGLRTWRLSLQLFFYFEFPHPAQAKHDGDEQEQVRMRTCAGVRAKQCAPILTLRVSRTEVEIEYGGEGMVVDGSK